MHLLKTLFMAGLVGLPAMANEILSHVVFTGPVTTITYQFINDDGSLDGTESSNSYGSTSVQMSLNREILGVPEGAVVTYAFSVSDRYQHYGEWDIHSLDLVSRTTTEIESRWGSYKNPTKIPNVGVYERESGGDNYSWDGLVVALNNRLTIGHAITYEWSLGYIPNWFSDTIFFGEGWGYRTVADYRIDYIPTTNLSVIVGYEMPVIETPEPTSIATAAAGLMVVILRRRYFWPR